MDPIDQLVAELEAEAPQPDPKPGQPQGGDNKENTTCSMDP